MLGGMVTSLVVVAAADVVVVEVVVDAAVVRCSGLRLRVRLILSYL